MLLSAFNPLDIVLFIQRDKKKKTKKGKDVNIELSNISSHSNDVNHNNESISTSSHIQNNNSNHPIIEHIIDRLFFYFTNTMTYLGPFFSIALICFILYTYIATNKTIFLYYKTKHSPLSITFLQCITSIQLFYIITNYILATIIKPGSISDLKRSKYYKEHNAYYNPILNFPYKATSSHIEWKKCKKCAMIKPLRTHHCSICNCCVFKMDHHCPWINNCIGQNNHRYFLLFIIHLFLYAFFIAVLSIPMIINGYFFKLGKEFRLICVLSIAGMFILLFFNCWNWFLAVNGVTTIEFWSSQLNNTTTIINNFSFNNWRDNLFYIFGSKSIINILFIPSITKLPFSGLEWSKYIDNDFSIDGIPDSKSLLSYSTINTEEDKV